MREPPNKFIVVGTGKVGTSLGTALESAGYQCSCLVVHTRSRKRGISAKFLSSDVVDSVDDVKDDFDFAIIAVKDDELYPVAEALSSVKSVDWRSKIVFHTSGSVELDALSKLKSMGACVGALHPLSPFAGRFLPEKAKGIYYDLIGDRPALSLAKSIVRRLQSRFVILKSERERVLLHVASVLVSNFTVIAERQAEMMVAGLVGTKNSRAIMSELLRNTVENLDSRKGFDALTGPLVRGDSKVIKKHLEVLEKNRFLLQFYKSSALLGIESLLRANLQDPLTPKLVGMKKILEGK